MGFKLGRTYRLVFGGDLAGAEIKLRSTPIGAVLRVREADVKDLSDMLAEYVIDWNLETPDGQPLPVTGEAIREHMEESVLSLIVKHWFQAAVGVTAPLDDGSTSGESFQEASIPME
jgi:hypothetical protein